MNSSWSPSPWDIGFQGLDRKWKDPIPGFYWPTDVQAPAVCLEEEMLSEGSETVQRAELELESKKGKVCGGWFRGTSLSEIMQEEDLCESQSRKDNPNSFGLCIFSASYIPMLIVLITFPRWVEMLRAGISSFIVTVWLQQLCGCFFPCTNLRFP